MEEQQPSFLLRGTPFDLRKFLIDRTGNEPNLVRNGDRKTIFDANTVMNGKVMMLCFFSLPLPSDAIPLLQAVSLASSEMHAFGAFELIIFVDYFTDCNNETAALSNFFSIFPSFCLTSVYTHRLGAAAMPLACYPHGLLVNRAKKVEWHKPLHFLLKYGVDAFPFTSERLSWISQREQIAMSCKSWRSLHNFLCSMPFTSPSYSTFLGKNPGGGPGEVTICDLWDKCVGLYLCQTGNLIPTLDIAHKKCCELDLEFEIILVYMPFNYIGDPQLFQHHINSILMERNISWWVFPFINWVSRRLSRLFHQDSDDRLIIVGPKCEYVEFHGEAVIRHHSASAYPFSRELLVNREVERLRAVTLESLLVYSSLDYVLWMGSGFTHRVPVAALQGKTVFLYLHCAKDHSGNCFDKLFSYCQMKAPDPNFDMVFVRLDTSSIPDIGNSCEMPWLVFPWDPNHSDYVTRTIFGKGDKCSTIIAFGKDGRISSIRALRLVCSSCQDFPLSNNLHNEMSAELAGSKVVHAVPSNLHRHSRESRNHVKALFPLLGEEYFFPALPFCGRMKPSEEMHDFYDSVDEVERAQYLSESEYLANQPIEPFDPSKCTAAGAGVSRGHTGSPTSFVLTVKDSDGRKIPNWGGEIVVKVIPSVGVRGFDIDGVVKDQGDGTYSVTYLVTTGGNYMVNVECNGFPIMGSPFPVFFSGGSVSSTFSGLGRLIPGLVPCPSEGLFLHGIEAICPEFLNGQCFKTDCNLKHPPHRLLLTAIEETSSMRTMRQVPIPPSAPTVATAQAIMATQVFQALAAQQAQPQSSNDSADHSVPNITAHRLKRLFGVRGTVVELN